MPTFSWLMTQSNSLPSSKGRRRGCFSGDISTDFTRLHVPEYILRILISLFPQPRSSFITFIRTVVYTYWPYWSTSGTYIEGNFWYYLTDTWFRPHKPPIKWGDSGQSISETVTDSRPDFSMCIQKLVHDLKSNTIINVSNEENYKGHRVTLIDTK